MSKDSCKMIEIFFSKFNPHTMSRMILKQKSRMFPAKTKIVHLFKVPWLCSRVPVFTEYFLVTIESSSERLREQHRSRNGFSILPIRWQKEWLFFVQVHV